jgi:hypothetical protein
VRAARRLPVQVCKSFSKAVAVDSVWSDQRLVRAIDPAKAARLAGLTPIQRARAMGSSQGGWGAESVTSSWVTPISGETRSMVGTQVVSCAVSSLSTPWLFHAFSKLHFGAAVSDSHHRELLSKRSCAAVLTSRPGYVVWMLPLGGGNARLTAEGDEPDSSASMGMVTLPLVPLDHPSISCGAVGTNHVVFSLDRRAASSSGPEIAVVDLRRLAMGSFVAGAPASPDAVGSATGGEVLCHSVIPIIPRGAIEAVKANLREATVTSIALLDAPDVSGIPPLAAVGTYARPPSDGSVGFGCAVILLDLSAGAVLTHCLGHGSGVNTIALRHRGNDQEQWCAWRRKLGSHAESAVELPPITGAARSTGNEVGDAMPFTAASASGAVSKHAELLSSLVLVSGDRLGGVIAWDVLAGTPVWSVRGSDRQIRSLEVDCVSDRLWTVGFTDGVFREWGLSTGELLSAAEAVDGVFPHQEQVLGMHMDPFRGVAALLLSEHRGDEVTPNANLGIASLWTESPSGAPLAWLKPIGTHVESARLPPTGFSTTSKLAIRGQW